MMKTAMTDRLIIISMTAAVTVILCKRSFVACNCLLFLQQLRVLGYTVAMRNAFRLQNVMVYNNQKLLHLGFSLIILSLANLHAAADSRNFVTWFNNNGGKASKVRLMNSGLLRQLVAAAPIKAGEVVIKTPPGMIMNKRVALEVPEIAAMYVDYEEAKIEVLDTPEKLHNHNP